MRVLGIDPGTGRLGWAVVDKEKGNESLIDCGLIETPARTILVDRLELIFNELNRLIREHKPDEASVEELFFATNKKTAMEVSAARGVVLLSCQLAHLKISQYTPLQIKSSLTGYGNADKKQVEFMVKQILKIKSLPYLDDTIDAIAAALTHASFSRKTASGL
jgi:crossover junction endodeoxyribonuclease RuvC